MSEEHEWTDWIPYCGEKYLAGVEIGMIVQIRGISDGEKFTSKPCVVVHEIMRKVVIGPKEEIHAHRILKPRALEQLRAIAALPQHFPEVEESE